jgi:hypothetical protein
VNALKKAGVVLVLTGIFLPFATLPFTSGYKAHGGVVYNIQHMGFELKENSFLERNLRGITEYKSMSDKTFYHFLPYKYVFTASVLLVFAGSVIAIL